MATYLWDPFAALGRMDREFDEIVRRAWGTRRPALATRAQDAELAVPSADVVADGEDVVINLELPGVDVERDVVVEIDRGRLVVRGQRGGQREEARGGRVHRERWSGGFRREFRLPERVDAARISAGYERGVLSVRLAGAAVEPKATRIAVTPARDGAIPEVAPVRSGDAPAPAATESAPGRNDAASSAEATPSA
ncbi:Molecular chaperone (Small heat shock protein) [Frankia canadensis]|uniref:Molecular chaperone (Small heat shock protein) n=1 Tax=Frankia canadensis TaxID=1836972 RepID=A0A2I2KVJ2_9ACTN|nr:Hsp20/alpha crystallin family protein [Frankia canadensis]SNQ49680.1 Molecular chaperone (Small heat shock protein) [Frankia canadensis]SOU56970.1 Molecular chaperone (Small heat shock protein) [Frankia canadensis]